MDETFAEPSFFCERAAQALRNKISPEEYESVVEYIEYNECGLSMEMLIDYLGDREASITQEEFELIYDAMDAMCMEKSSRLASVRKLIAAE